jgi:hypothetical protein
LPFSMLDFVRTDGVRDFNGHLTSDDAGCTWKMQVAQSRSWSVNGHFHDGGILAGDFFFAEFLLDTSHPAGIQTHGVDPWIRANWEKFENSDPTRS